MPRRLRVSTGGVVYHVLNRAVRGERIFRDHADYLAMEQIIERTFDRLPMRIVSYCLTPDHWHMVLWPKKDGQLSDFMRLLTVTHTQRWHAKRRSAGSGPLYQGRFKSFPIQQGDHLLAVCRYVEQNALRSKRVKSAGDWAWGSLAKRSVKQPPKWLLPLDRWPAEPPARWPAYVNRPQTEAELKAIRLSVNRGRPYGDERWQARTAAKLGLESTFRPRGRQRIHPVEESRGL